MTMTACELLARTRRFSARVQTICAIIAPCPEANRIVPRLLKGACELASCYAVASRSRSRDEFIERISVVANHARRASRLLRLLLDSGHLRIEQARDVMWEARALVALFEASVRTAKRKRAKTAMLL
jgi:hypothetical protein